MEALTAFQQDALAMVAILDKPSGQTIRRNLEVEAPAGYDDVGHGRLYPSLDVLVQAGLVSKGEQDRRTNYYEITETGEDLLANQSAWLGRGLDE